MQYQYVHDGGTGGATGSPVTIHEAQYNGLSWRVVKRADTGAPAEIGGLDEMRVMIYSAGWQMLEERVDAGWAGSGFTMDKVYQTIYGLRYIDDVICRRLDTTANGSYDSTFYHLTDNQFSTVAVTDENANLLERVAYDPYGRPLRQDFSDVRCRWRSHMRPGRRGERDTRGNRPEWQHAVPTMAGKRIQVFLKFRSKKAARTAAENSPAGLWRPKGKVKPPDVPNKPGQSPHYHDNDHNKPRKPNRHYGW